MHTGHPQTSAANTITVSKVGTFAVKKAFQADDEEDFLANSLKRPKIAVCYGRSKNIVSFMELSTKGFGFLILILSAFDIHTMTLLSKVK